MATKQERKDATDAFLLANGLLSSFVKQRADGIWSAAVWAEWRRLHGEATEARAAMERTREPD